MTFLVFSTFRQISVEENRKEMDAQHLVISSALLPGMMSAIFQVGRGDVSISITAM
jgi:hypothetical protein